MPSGLPQTYLGFPVKKVESQAPIPEEIVFAPLENLVSSVQEAVSAAHEELLDAEMSGDAERIAAARNRWAEIERHFAQFPSEEEDD